MIIAEKMTLAPCSDTRAAKEAVAEILNIDIDAPNRSAAASNLFRFIDSMAEIGTKRDDPMRGIFFQLGNRWSLLLLFLLRTGTFRHSILRRLVNNLNGDNRTLSQHMLTLCLRALERDGLIMRTKIAGSAPHVEYSITPLGLGLMSALDHTFEWIRRHDKNILSARQRYSQRGRSQEANPSLSEIAEFARS